MLYLAVITIGYLLGCSSMATYLSKWKRVDIRSKGSGNLGASNVTVLLGWQAGVLTAVHDIGKAVLAVLAAKLLFPSLTYGPEAAGVACVLGHIFPMFLGFRGGKGFASYFGMTLALNWKMAVAIAVVIVLVTVITDYIALAALTTAVAVPAWLVLLDGKWAAALILCVVAPVMFWKHRDNIARMVKGTELGLRSAIRGDNRVK